MLDATWPYLPRSVQTRPSLYVRHTLSLIQRQAAARGDVDWPVVKRETLGRAKSAAREDDVHAALQHALTLVDGGQSVIVPPPSQTTDATGVYGLQVINPEHIVAVVFPGSAADAAGLRPGDVIEAVNGRPPDPHPSPRMQGHLIDLPAPAVSLRVRRPSTGTAAVVRLELGNYQPLPAEIRRLDDILGYVEIPGTAGPNDFAGRVRAAILSTDAPTVCGWIVDLRRNSGGGLATMLQALRPILGEGALGSFVDAGGRTTPWTYPAEAGVGPGTALGTPSPPVAALTSRLTAGAGESLVMALRARERYRTFGESTWGLSSGTTAIELPDGATLQLVTSREADASGAIRSGPIEPDQSMDIDWARLGAPDDPVALAAGRWLFAQPSCKAMAAGRLGDPQR